MSPQPQSGRCGRLVTDQPFRLDDTLLNALDERAERGHTTRSELIRAALRSYPTSREDQPFRR